MSYKKRMENASWILFPHLGTDLYTIGHRIIPTFKHSLIRVVISNSKTYEERYTKMLESRKIQKKLKKCEEKSKKFSHFRDDYRR